MRIQHNIMAMNAYRNYNTNTSALSKNLEKLSSGYKINRAGDDAAGLAISEKMRAQISGLEQASNNVKDGISLVQTAEGALQEVQDMLNRMVTLSEQSANGTYQDDVDRENLQSEMDALTSEINRIADSSNFNGINLLDGSLSGAAKITTTPAAASTAGTVVLDFTGLTGNSNPIKAGADQIFSGVDAGTKSAAALATFLDAKTLTIDGHKYTAAASGTKVTLTAQTKGDNSLAAATFALTGATGTATAATVTDGTDAVAAGAKLDFTGVNSGKEIMGSTVTVDNTTYQFVTDAANVTNGNTAVVITDADTATTIAGNLATAITNAGTNTATDGTDGTLTVEEATAGAGVSVSQTGGGLKLQIGDTADSFNQMSVMIDDMHASNLGIDVISVKNQSAAADAIDVIKNAINQVSATRGTLGATQNRLEHTTNNLSVMTENIQDAESTIRDTDIAEEMMSYTKNNILVQSAQAMLAQANTVPQGVLQLLQ